MDDAYYLRLSFEQAIDARDLGDGPFGALIIDEHETIIAQSGNTTNSENSVVYHAEINALQQAEYKRGKCKLKGCTLVSSAEPCPMCASAIVWAGISRVVYSVSIEALQSRGMPQLSIGCRKIFSQAARSISVKGPLIQNEGLQVFAHN